MSDFNSSLPTRTQIPGQANYDDMIVKIGDSTNPATQQLTVNSDGSVNVTDNGGSLTVDAVDFDIRNLDYTADSVSVLQATHDSLNANANIQVNNTDVSNANPVPVSDAGGSITVDGTVTVTATDLDIRNLNATQDNVAISDGTDTLAINNDGSINSVVTATNLDIRDLTHVSDSVKVGDGTDFLAINSDGSINVIVQEDVGTEVVNYNTAAGIAASATSNHDFTFTNGGKLYQVLGSASGKLKVEVQVETGAATGTFNTVAVRFNSSAAPDCDMELIKYAAVPTGARVRVIRTNRDALSQDVYTTIVGIAN